MEKLYLPYNGECKFVSRYGWRQLNGEWNEHKGIDLVGLTNKIIVAPANGVVGVSTMIPKETDKTLTWQWGNYVRVDCDNGLSVYMCHMNQRYVVAGQRVNVGDPIGLEGWTGYCVPAGEGGRHCHFEVRKNGVSVDPTPYLEIPNDAGIYSNNKPIKVETVKEEAIPVPEEKVQKVLDNEPADWAKKAVSWAIKNKIIEGDQKGNLKLHDNITVERFIVMLYRAFEAQYRYYDES